RVRAVRLVERLQHGTGGGDEDVGVGDAAADTLAVGVPLGAGRAALDRLPPGLDAGVPDDEHGRTDDRPVERRVGEAVEVHDVGLYVRRDVQQQLPRAVDVVPRVLHPLELEVGFDDLESGHGI